MALNMYTIDNQSSYDMYAYMYPQRAIISLQGLDRHALTVGAISVPIAKLEPSFDAISSAVELHGEQKALWKSIPIDISKWRQ